MIFLDACGGLIEASNGTITSPSFPELYPANKNCIWEILAPPQWRVTVNFTHFDIEGNNVIYYYLKMSHNNKRTIRPKLTPSPIIFFKKNLGVLLISALSDLSTLEALLIFS